MSVAQQVLVGKPRLGSGQKDKLVTIQQMTQSKGTSGAPKETWTNLSTAWMSRQDARADERFSSNQLSAAVETTWHCDYRADLDRDLVAVTKLRRLVYSGTTYDILAATVMDQKKGIELVTIAKVDG